MTINNVGWVREPLLLKISAQFLRSLGTSFKNGLAWDESKKDALVATQPMNKAKIKTLF